jgi:hypothetical protein
MVQWLAEYVSIHRRASCLGLEQNSCSCLHKLAFGVGFVFHLRRDNCGREANGWNAKIHP